MNTELEENKELVLFETDNIKLEVILLFRKQADQQILRYILSQSY